MDTHQSAHWGLSIDSSVSSESHGVFFLSEEFRLHYYTVPVSEDISADTHRIYNAIFAEADSWFLARMWNFIPEINAIQNGMEHYRSFCEGRSLAFYDCFGCSAEARMPAATGVGGKNESFVVAVLYSKSPVKHLENPRQVPAYCYPVDYGPRSPSFARATLCSSLAFISGTSAIRGHQSLGGGNVSEQLQITLDNLQVMQNQLLRAGMTESFKRYIVVYLRNSGDLKCIGNMLKQGFFSLEDGWCILQADICRAELDVEIEITYLLEKS
ncbi:MAG: hypothetical protein JW739_07580 [Opitutales bacterium]|nr:hypothetical protein [Opitutales bacterium]